MTFDIICEYLNKFQNLVQINNFVLYIASLVYLNRTFAE